LNVEGRFAENPAYLEYESLLVRLHALITEGEGDSEQADTVREQMEPPERKLNRPEQDRLNGLSADLYMLSGEEVLQHPPVAPTQDELHEHLKEYEQWNDWQSVLALLRRRPHLVNDDAVAFTRARAYAALGHHLPALLFFEFCMKRRPHDPDMQALYLFRLKDAGFADRAIAHARQYAASPGASPDLLIAVAATYFEIGGGGEAQTVLSLLSRALVSISPPNRARVRFVVLAYVLAAHCLALLGRSADAVAALDEALRLRPGDAAIMEARDSVLESGTRDVAERFKRAAEKFRLPIEQLPTVTAAQPVWGKAA
jgi:tetratricopeptide (TPR) repeat protein